MMTLKKKKEIWSRVLALWNGSELHFVRSNNNFHELKAKVCDLGHII
jgi:hypothetical protein